MHEISEEMTQTPNKEKKEITRRESAKIDETVKLTFSVSKEMLVHSMNGLFNETFDPKDVEITKTTTEFVSNNLDIIRADLFLNIINSKIPYHYHIEFQMKPDGDMVIRMFKYDIAQALERRRLEGHKDDKIVLQLAKSLVIHFEKSDTIPDEYTLEIVFPDNSTHEYKVGVMKFWEYNEQDLIDKKLYNLLPLQSFRLRSDFDNIWKNDDEGVKREISEKIAEASEKIIGILKQQYIEEQFSLQDLDKLSTAHYHLTRHLENRYGCNTNVSKGIETMIKTFLNKNLEERERRAEERGEKRGKNEAKIETAMKMLLDNKPIDEIVKYTGLSKTKINEIKKTVATPET